MNHEVLRQRYSEYRWKMKAAKTTEKRAAIKKEMSDFLKAIADSFGQETASLLTSKKSTYGAAANVQQRHHRE